MNITLTEIEFNLLTRFVKSGSINISDFSKQKLSEELKTATILDKEKIPKDIVQIYSKVHIKELGNKSELRIQLVLPSESDVKKNKVSVFAPIGVALIGYKKGDIVEWEVPSGMKKYKIIEVINQL